MKTYVLSPFLCTTLFSILLPSIFAFTFSIAILRVEIRVNSPSDFDPISYVISLYSNYRICVVNGFGSYKRMQNGTNLVESNKSQNRSTRRK